MSQPPPPYRLIYFSRADIRQQTSIQTTVRSILTVSQHRNRQAGVTGLLIHASGFFAQALEGDREAVEETFARIARDVRHSLPVVVAQSDISARAFANWSMCGRCLSATDSLLISRLDERGGFNPAAMSADDLLSLLIAIGQVHEAEFDRQSSQTLYL